MSATFRQNSAVVVRAQRAVAVVIRDVTNRAVDPHGLGTGGNTNGEAEPGRELHSVQRNATVLVTGDVSEK